jgi:large subunit ribosomal protein L33
MADNRKEVILVCSECHSENYITTRNTKNVTARMEAKKFCPHCRKKTLHKEKR